MNGEELQRLIAAVERLAPPRVSETDWSAAPAYAWTGRSAHPIAAIVAPRLGQLRGIDRQKRAVAENLKRLAAGVAAHDMLLWGARGMGKSALLRAATISAQQDQPSRLAIVQTAGDALSSLPQLFQELGAVERNFLIFLDDLAFSGTDAIGPRQLRSLLDGGIEARPANVRLAITTNHRIIQSRVSDGETEAEAMHRRDALDDTLALADRFGLSVGFHACDQATYLAIVAEYAAPLNLRWTDDDALQWARQRGARSGRTAWQFVVELAGRANLRL
ncbi:DUF815 domain-containing protein [Pseudopontixanthobacter vadosimaris]|uniref:DUF815 domain-containing protein n=1 Tax=Pseudopontixanthobacter vadosimaris TaxID=2726450 RepID=UPI0014752E00|nr:DUF815 domain-containing protein [Pseudopontixanthobacter vadosimaris]